MAAPFLIIDGYNLLHAAGLARRRYARGQMERARRALVNLLARHLSEHARRRTTVVFDAQTAPSDATAVAPQRGITVLFAPPGGDADTYIEQLIRRHSAPKQIVVISGDRRLQRAASRRRGHWLDSESFHTWLLAPADSRGDLGGTTSGKPVPPGGQPVTPSPATDTTGEAPAPGSSPQPEADQPAVADSGQPAPPHELDDAAFWQQRVDELQEEEPRRRRKRKRR